MGQQPKWSREEIALLIEAYLEIKKSPKDKENILIALSSKLRNMAVNAGLDIDETYRNLNGMFWQYAFIEKAFQKSSFGTHKPPKLFCEMVDLYEDNIEEFEKYLNSAKEMSGISTHSAVKNSDEIMEDQKSKFLEWLNLQQKLKLPANLIVSVINECSEYAVKHKISKIDFWHITEPKVYDMLAKKLMGMRFFRIIHRSTAKNLDKTYKYYRDFLEEELAKNIQNMDDEKQLKTETAILKTEDTLQPEPALVKSVEVEPTPSSFDIEEHLQKFSAWLAEKGMAPSSCNGYASSLKSMLVYLKEKKIIENDFFELENEELKAITKTIFSNDDFLNYNTTQHNRFSAAYKKYIEFRGFELSDYGFARKKSASSKPVKSKGKPGVEFKFQGEVTRLLKSHYSFGYRVESVIEMKRFRKYAELDCIELPDSDEVLKQEIINAGFLIEDKVFVICEETISGLANIFVEIIEENNAQFVFFEPVYERFSAQMEEWHITSSDMLREILIENRDEIFEYDDDRLFFAKNFVSFVGRTTERDAVTLEMKRVWGDPQVQQVDILVERLPWIQERYIGQYLTANRHFVWVSEGMYMSVDRLIISPEEVSAVFDFAVEQCEKMGYAPLSDIPLGNMVEENYEISTIPLLNAIYNKVLYDKFYLNGKILTRENNGIDVVVLAKQYISGRDECTFTEVNEKVFELSGATYRYMAYDALYNTMVRIDEENYVSERHVCFDVEAIDDILSKMIADRFVAIKEISTFAVFPMCGQAWNHYLLESYCYRFSKKYCLRILGFNDKNAGMICEKDMTEDYNELLAIAAARSKIELNTKNVGEFFFQVGYMGKRKFSGLESVTERAISIREEK